MHNLDFESPAVSEVINFLETMFSKGLSYSSLNTARSALGTFISFRDSQFTVGNDPLISRFLRGAYNLRPYFSKTPFIWNVSVVLKHLKSWSPTEELSLKQLTLKLIMLIALLSGQRVQTLHLLSIDSMDKTNDSVKFVVNHLVKQSRPGYSLPPIDLRAFPDDRDLCVVSTLNVYLDRTRDYRKNGTQLFLSYQKPHSAVSTDTIARWIKSVLSASGIDTDKYKAHSTRSASTSAAFYQGIPIQTIMNAAGWTNECTFRRFYQKEVQNETIGQSVLSKANVH